MTWKYDNGGRTDSGFKGDTRDCVTRAIAIATGMNYTEVYELIKTFSTKERPRKKRNGALKKRSHPRTGVKTATIKKVMAHLGWEWVPLMSIGTGCKVHLREGELPSGNIVCSLSRHVCAVKDGVVHDTYDPSRDGTRCVYGYWKEIEK